MNLARIVVAFSLCFASTLTLAAELAPDELVRNTVTEVLDVIKKDKDIQAGDKKKIKSLIETKVLPHFDFTRMTRLAMGRFWNQASPAQQQELTGEFRSLLVRTYSTSLSTYRDQKIDFKPFKMNPGETEAVVKTAILQSGNRAIPIDYTLGKNSNSWKVYDIAVDGVSLVVNYRSSFAQEIQQGGVAQLITALHAKNNNSLNETQKN